MHGATLSDWVDSGLPTNVGLWRLGLNARGQVMELETLARPNIRPNSLCGLGAEAKPTLLSEGPKANNLRRRNLQMQWNVWSMQN